MKKGPGRNELLCTAEHCQLEWMDGYSFIARERGVHAPADLLFISVNKSVLKHFERSNANQIGV